MHGPADFIVSDLSKPEPALADADFSAGVLARLPPHRRRSAARRWTLAGAAALGSALTLILAPPLESAVASLAPYSVPPLAVAAAATVAIVAIPALLVFYSVRSDR